MALPELFGHYLLHRRLARGATSVIYVAQTMGDFPRLCAVKRINPDLATLPDFDERFRDDARLLVRLIHGNLAQVLEVGVHDEQPFVAMELIDGIDLHDLIADVPRLGTLNAEVALYLGIEMCEAISYLQARRREQGESAAHTLDRAWPLKPMLSFDGVVKLIALGSSSSLRLAEMPPADMLRHPGYASPEVILGEPLDARSDVFAIGLVVWDTLVGRHLIASSPDDYARQVREGSWQAPLASRQDVPSGVIRLLSGMLALDPDARPPGLEQVRTQLVAALRRLDPAYGSSSLARLLMRRYPDLIGRSEAVTEQLLRKALTIRAQPAGSRTLTLSRAGLVDRPLSKPVSLKPGDRIPGTRYRLVRSLGEGAGAEVFAAQHIDLARQAALKILSPQLAAQSDAIAQFRMEARTCSRIGHPNIVDVIDFGELEDGRFFFAMELLQGETLGSVLTRECKISPERAIAISRQIAKAVQAAHQHGIVHRDLKPDNIMLVERDGRPDFVKVLDFGVMAFSDDQRAERVGTPGYMAPEQFGQHKASYKMDIYAMGVVLYEALCGELPHRDDSLKAYHEAQLAGPSPALRSRARGGAIPAELERVVHHALERDPAARHPSAADFEADLIRAQRAAGLVTGWDDLPEPGKLRDRRSDRASSPHGKHRGAGRRLPSALTWTAGVSAAAIIVALVALSTTRSLTRSSAPSPTQTLPASPPETPVALAPHPSATPPPSDRTDERRQREAEENAAAESKPASPPPRAQRGRTVPATASARASEMISEGQSHLAELRLDQAKQRFQDALSIAPRDATAWSGLAAVAFQQARYQDTLRFARRALALSPRLVAAHLALGDTYLKLQQRDRAIGAWRDALAIDPSSRIATERIARAEGMAHPSD